MISLTTLLCVASAVAIEALASITLVCRQWDRGINTYHTLLGKGHCAATFDIQKVADRVAPGTFQLLQTGPPDNQLTQ